MGKEYLAYPGEHYPGETWPFAATTVDDDTQLVHSPKGWEWERVPTSEIPDYAAIVPDLLGATTAAAETLDVPLDRVTPAGSVNAVSTAVVRELWSKVVTAEKGVFLQVTADMIEANAITADKISVGALDGQIITGAVIRTAEEGARTQIDTSGMRVYNTNGDITLDIDSSGSIEIYGSIGRKDTWSECKFTDLVDPITQRDEGDTHYHGVGLAFASRRFQKDGTITVSYNKSEHTGSLRLIAPSTSTGQRPEILLDEKYIGMYNKQSRIDIRENSIYIADRSGDYTMSVSNAGLSFRRSGNTDLYSNAAGFGIGMGSNKSNVWGTAASVVAGTSAQKFLQINQNGNYVAEVHGGGMHVEGALVARGGKNFMAEIPGLTEEHGGAMLMHSCTESPWSGIEYWATVEVGQDGKGEYQLPSYYKTLAREDVPAVVLCSGAMGPTCASLEGSKVSVTGVPGDAVSVLVKAARHVWYRKDGGDLEPHDEHANPEDRWQMPPPTPSWVEEAADSPHQDVDRIEA